VPASQNPVQIGYRFGRLTVASFSRIWKRNRWWLCKCDCGTEKEVRASRLNAGTTTSCGCFRIELHRTRPRPDSQLSIKHGATRGASKGRRWTPEYVSWRAMIQRTTDPHHEHYKYYGARGIKICKRWLHSFQDFLADMGPRPTGTTLDRKKNHLGYSPSNCRWATWKEQARNKNPRAIRTQCKKGHPFSGENLILCHNGKWIRCRTCLRAWKQNHKERIKNGT